MNALTLSDRNSIQKGKSFFEKSLPSTNHIPSNQNRKMPTTQQSSQRDLNGILSDELAGIAVPQFTFVNNVVQYLRFLWTTWTNVVLSMPYLISSPFTLLSVLFFAVGSSAFMFLMVPATAVLNKGWIQKIFAPNGVSLVNAGEYQA